MPAKRKPGRPKKVQPQPTQETHAPLIKQVQGKTGRPRVEITPAGWEQIERMSRALCTDDEIADYLGASSRVLYNDSNRERYTLLKKAKRAASLLAVRERQLEKAVSGNPVDSIWFGKQHLGQTDRQAVTGANGGPLEILHATAEDMLALLEKLERKAKADKPERDTE